MNKLSNSISKNHTIIKSIIVYYLYYITKMCIDIFMLKTAHLDTGFLKSYFIFAAFPFMHPVKSNSIL